MLCVITLFCTAMLVICITSSLPPVDQLPTAQAPTPFNNGFAKMFKIIPTNRFLTIFSIPATYATAFGFVFAAGRVTISMANSGLFPPLMKRTFGKYKTPYMALIFGSIFGYGLCIWNYFDPQINLYLFNICMLSASISYIAQLLGYILYVTQFAGKIPDFKSPFGIPGAVLGILIFTFPMIGVIGFQDDGYIAIITFTVMLGFYTIYYFIYASKRQTFSSEEKNVFFQLHVIKCKYFLLIIIMIVCYMFVEMLPC